MAAARSKEMELMGSVMAVSRLSRLRTESEKEFYTEGTEFTEDAEKRSSISPRWTCVDGWGGVGGIFFARGGRGGGSLQE